MMRMNEEQQQGRGFSLTLALVLALPGAILTLVAIYELWPWMPVVSIALLLAGVMWVGQRWYISSQHHRLDLQAKRNRVGIVHESEQGFGYITESGYSGYSHVQALPDPVVESVAPQAETYPQTFSDMMRAGFVAPGADFIPGFDEQGQPVRLREMTSLGISGVPGSGKTVTTTLLMLEAIAKYNGAVRFLVVDPHMHVAGDESLAAKVQVLSPYFLTLEDVRMSVPADDRDYLALLERSDTLSNPLEGGEGLVWWMQVVQLEMDRRLHGKQGDVWVIVMDEFAAVMGSEASSSVASMLERLNQQARKVGMFALLVSQEWKATRTGGSELRHSIVSFIVHNTPEQIASLIVPSDVASLAPTMGRGQAVFHSLSTRATIRVPLTTELDARLFMMLYPPPVKARVLEEPGLPIITGEVKEIAPPKMVGQAPVEFSTVELREIRSLFLSGMSVRNIAKQVYRVRSGPDLETAEQKVQRALKWMVDSVAV